MMSHESENTRSKIRVIKKIKSIHPVVDNIAVNLAEIDIIQYITISTEILIASS
jgi:hypothetical protein